MAQFPQNGMRSASHAPGAPSVVCSCPSDRRNAAALPRPPPRALPGRLSPRAAPAAGKPPANRRSSSAVASRDPQCVTPNRALRRAVTPFSAPQSAALPSSPADLRRITDPHPPSQTRPTAARARGRCSTGRSTALRPPPPPPKAGAQRGPPPTALRSEGLPRGPGRGIGIGGVLGSALDPQAPADWCPPTPPDIQRLPTLIAADHRTGGSALGVTSTGNPQPSVHQQTCHQRPPGHA